MKPHPLLDDFLMCGLGWAVVIGMTGVLVYELLKLVFWSAPARAWRAIK